MRLQPFALIVGLTLWPIAAGAELHLVRASYRDKLAGGWIGQMVGVTWGAPTEFKYLGRIIPPEEVPVWSPALINGAYEQDDLYVELVFLQAMFDHGVTCDWIQFGEALRQSSQTLWAGNLLALFNLRRGLDPPASGHWKENEFCDAIDWQIESNFIGLLCPGQEQAAVDIAWRAGHVVGHGDGVYGGVMVAAMEARAFFAQSVDEIVEAGRQAVPRGSRYRQLIEDVLEWHRAEPGNWEGAWRALDDKWGTADRDPFGAGNGYNIDAKLNGGNVLLGLLYGDGDFERSLTIAMRAGQDSDCNPSTVGGILGIWLGAVGIPEKFKAGLDQQRTFSGSPHSLDEVLRLSEDLARTLLVFNGGTIAGDGAEERWTVQSITATPLLLEQWPEQASGPPVLECAIKSQDGLEAEFAASSPGSSEPVTYQWFLGDLSYQDGAAVSHVYREPGTYLVTCYASNPRGETSWQSLEVTVSAPSGCSCQLAQASGRGGWWAAPILLGILALGRRGTIAATRRRRARVTSFHG